MQFLDDMCGFPDRAPACSERSSAMPTDEIDKEDDQNDNRQEDVKIYVVEANRCSGKFGL